MASPPQVKPRVKPRVKINSAQYFHLKPPSLKIGSEISRGAYGSVHSGELGGRPVAVKRIHRLLLEAARGQGDFDQVMANFKRECQLLEQIDHPHVVDFCGARPLIAVYSSFGDIYPIFVSHIRDCACDSVT